MSGYRRLRYSQAAYRGSEACTYTACYLAYACLADPRLVDADLLSEASAEVLDEYVRRGCEAWLQLKLPSAQPALNVLRQDPFLQSKLQLQEDQVSARQDLRDASGELVLESTEAILWKWINSSSPSCCIVTTWDGYSFLVVPPVGSSAVAYAVIDTHSDTIERRGHALSRLSIPVQQTGQGGLIWSTLFPSEVVHFVLEYCQTSSPEAQTDLSILALRAQL
jgi:hypothetical protein